MVSVRGGNESVQKRFNGLTRHVERDQTLRQIRGHFFIAHGFAFNERLDVVHSQTREIFFLHRRQIGTRTFDPQCSHGMSAKIFFDGFAARVAAVNVAHRAVCTQQVRAIDEQIESAQSLRF